MPQIYNSLDLLVSSSCGEGFSNAIAEAMACGVPCVVTDVGDSAQIVGGTGIVVPPRNPLALAEGILGLVGRREFLDGTLKKACRERMAERFTLERLVENTAAILERLSCTE